MLPVVMFIFSLALLMATASLAAKFLEEAIENLGVSQGFLAATVGAIGTSLAELAISFFALAFGNSHASSLIFGDVVGSFIFNTLLISAVAIADRAMKAPSEVYLNLVFAFFFFLFSLDRSISFFEAFLFLLFYIAYLRGRTFKERESGNFNPGRGLESLVYAFASILAVVISSQLVVKSSILLARQIGATKLVGVILGMGTSLPELVLALAMVKRNRHEFAVIEALSSNLFNIGTIFFIPSLLGFTNNAPLFDISFCLFSALLLLFSFRLKRIGALPLLLAFAYYVLNMLG